MTARPQAIRSVRARERARTLEEDFQFLEKLQVKRFFADERIFAVEDVLVFNSSF